MRLISTIFLASGIAFILVAMGSVTMLHAVPPPPLFIALLMPAALFFGLHFVKRKEDGVLLPFAAAGDLFSFDSGLTVGVGAIIFVFGLVRFLDIKDTLSKSHQAAWIAACLVCAAAPYWVVRLSTTIFSMLPPGFLPAVSGLVIFLIGFIMVAFEKPGQEKR